MSSILIVESNLRIAEVIVVLLRQKGLHCFIEISKEDAEQRIQSNISFAAIFVSDLLQEVPFSVANRETSHSFIAYLRKTGYGGKVVHSFDKKRYSETSETEETFPFILIEVQKEGEETSYIRKYIGALTS